MLRQAKPARGDGWLVILRGVNLNPGADSEDMVSIRMWIEAHRLIALRPPTFHDDCRGSHRGIRPLVRAEGSSCRLAMRW